IAGESRAGEERAVVEARVVELVGEDLRMAIRERREDPQVRGVTAAEEEGSRESRECGKCTLRFLVCARMPGDQGRGARAHAESLDRGDRRRAKPRMVRKAEVVVAGKVRERCAALAHGRALGTFEDPAYASQRRRDGLQLRRCQGTRG